MAATTEGLRERKKRQTREAIAQAAMALFVEHGFDAVTVADVARAADVSEKTVFNYFPAKEDLVLLGGEERRAATVMTFSGGMRRRLEIARGFLHSPRVLFLDEPTIGLDPQTRASICRYIRALQQTEETTIFMTTHYMDEAEFCDRIAIMDRGEIVVLDTPEALKARVGADRVQIQTADDEATIEALQSVFGLAATHSEGAVAFFVESGEEFVPRLFAELGVAIRSVSVSRPTLDDVFMRYTGTTIRDAESDAGTHANRVAMRMMSGARR